MQTAQEVINALGSISKARYLAMDEDGEWFAFIEKPKIGSFSWLYNQESYNSLFLKNSFFNIQSAENWKESLVEYQPKI